MKAIEVYKQTQKLREEQDEIPWAVKRIFRDGHFEIDIVGEQVSCGEDYVQMYELRGAFEFIVEQLGGKIKWSK